MTINKLFILSAILYLNIIFVMNSQAQTGYTDIMPLATSYPPSVRASSMGFAGVANGGTVQEAYINPASIGVMQQKLQTEFTSSSPVFIEKNSNTFFFGIGYKASKKLALSLSRYWYIAKHPNWIPSIGPVFFVPTKEEETYYTFSASYQLIPGLYFGMNAHYLNYRLSPVKSTNSYFADAGLLYEKELKLKEGSSIAGKKLRLGLSYSNLNAASSKWVFPTGQEDIIYITSRLITGASFTTSLSTNKFIYGDVKLVPQNARSIDFLVQVQYVKFMPWNSKTQKNPFYWGLNSGAEILILKLVAFRFGYRYEKRFGDLDPKSHILNRPYLRGFTYGTGLNIPMRNLTNNKWPFDIAIDYMHRKPFTWVKKGYGDVEYPVTNVSLRLNWILR